jgi:hypothetical protein
VILSAVIGLYATRGVISLFKRFFSRPA